MIPAGYGPTNKTPLFFSFLDLLSDVMMRLNHWANERVWRALDFSEAPLGLREKQVKEKNEKPFQ